MLRITEREGEVIIIWNHSYSRWHFSYKVWLIVYYFELNFCMRIPQSISNTIKLSGQITKMSIITQELQIS